MSPTCIHWPGPPLSLTQVARPCETIQLMDGWTTTRWTEGRIVRHDGGMSASFVDGYVRWLSDKEFWRLDLDDDGRYWLHYGAADR